MRLAASMGTINHMRITYGAGRPQEEAAPSSERAALVVPMWLDGTYDHCCAYHRAAPLTRFREAAH